MCDLCKENGGEMEHCQQCGRMICFDESANNIDVIDRAYVTMSGDLFCRRCGLGHDREAERLEEEEAEEWDWMDEYPHNWYDPDCDTGLEDSTHVYIGPRDTPDEEGGDQQGVDSV